MFSCCRKNRNSISALEHLTQKNLFPNTKMSHRFNVMVQNLPKMDRIGHCDPYIEIDKDGERIHTTQVLKKTSDAVW